MVLLIYVKPPQRALQSARCKNHQVLSIFYS